MKKITSFLFMFSIAFIGSAQVTTYIDFGDPASTLTTPGNWNNITTTNLSEADLIDSDGTSTGVALTIDDVFDDVNPNGTSSPDASLPFPATATQDTFFGENVTFEGALEPTGGFILTGLDVAKYYSFRIFASRTGVSDNREALYTITGLATQTATLDAANNRTDTADILNIQPNVSGEITLTAAPGPNNDNANGFYYLGAIEMITTVGTFSTKENVLNSKISVSPNPIRNDTKIRFNLKNSAFLNVTIYDVTGRLVRTLKNEQAPAGDVSIDWNKSSDSNQEVSSGLYLLRIKADNTTHTSKLIVK
ncbi:T9SS type A sorting domain-containing protein [Changchengzhania lutea]|uniref:T9SS type A sorting domain-containing protein n=1 Tax=Changchengzhania lutea TaxID=2049305 RepID=UPI00115D83E3|nr:T9SS type A sorting domain-containing protein [Changchengzhania lutea]